MCGITGIIYADRDQSVDASVLKSMTDALRYRGPDDEGLYIHNNVGLGHRRLSIIDIEGGHQPMSNEDESVWITYNGEIYNFLELRQELIDKGYRFKSRSDTEVLLRLYEDRGTDCLEALNGMFAFTILDLRKNQIFAARDRFGIKPFYYYSDPGKFLFASEIKALLNNPEIPKTANYEQIRNYLTFQFSLNEETFFKKIFSLLPGHYLILDLGSRLSPKITKYWDLDFDAIQDRPIGHFQDELLCLLEDSIRLQLRSDVPLGSHLSGGLDSTVVTCLASRLLSRPIKTFTGFFKDSSEYDETGYAREASRYSQSEYHEITATPRDFAESLSRLVYHLDEPTAGPGVFPQYFVSKLAREHVKVVLGGQGGDELYGGYTRYLIAYLEECLKGAIFETQKEKDPRFVVTFDSILPNLSTLKDYVPLMRHFWREGLFEDSHSRYFRLINRADGLEEALSGDLLHQSKEFAPFEVFSNLFNSLSDRSLINKMIHFDIKTLLPALLHVEDRVSMACSLESRVPLLDHRLAELMATVPPKIKFEGGRTKHLLRKVVDPYIPASILNRKDKKGFPVPLTEWFSGPLKGFVREVLLGKQARERGLYNANVIEKKLSNEPKFGRQIWGLLNLELWFQEFQDS